ncbi:MAG: hypothetical protein KDM64_15035, partial [Verrucomicrobiae bacterium]|nr:hypothetical protein [Verrucomicrobiae bacterium]
GLVAHYADGGDRSGVYAWDFTDSTEEFKQNLRECDSLPARHDEYGLPALDRALDFEWRPMCRRFVVSFTDEPVDGGHEPAFQRSCLAQLSEKFNALKVNGFLIGPACSAYDELGRAPRMVRVLLGHSDLARYDFARFLADLGRTVSNTAEQEVGGGVSRNLYRL